MYVCLYITSTHLCDNNHGPSFVKTQVEKLALLSVDFRPINENILCKDYPVL